MIFLGGMFYGISHSDQTSIVTIGDGYINVESTHFSYSSLDIASNSRNKNVTYEQIATAFVGQVGQMTLNYINSTDPILATQM